MAQIDIVQLQLQSHAMFFLLCCEVIFCSHTLIDPLPSESFYLHREFNMTLMNVHLICN